MPQMFRPGGLRKVFKSIEDGTKAGFWLSFQEMSKDHKLGKKRPDEPEQVKEDEPELQTEAPVPPAPEVIAGGPKPPTEYKEQARRPLPDMKLDEVKKLAEKYGLDPTVHHMTLRAQVEEKINAEGGSD